MECAKDVNGVEEREEESHFRIVWSPDSILFRREGGRGSRREKRDIFSLKHTLAQCRPPAVRTTVRTHV